MKKCLLSLAASLLLGGSVMSAEVVRAPFTVQNAPVALSRAATDDGYQLRFCGDLYQWYRLTNTSNVRYRLYIEITPEIATSLAGNTLTDISICPYFKSATTKKGSVFVTEDVNDTPVVSQDITVLNGYDGRTVSIQTVKLSEPYVIKEGVGFAYGFTVEGCMSNDFPVALDAVSATPFAGTVEVYDSDGNLGISYNLAEDNCNLFMYASTVGEKRELKNIISVSDVALGDFTLPVIDTRAESQDLYVVINNLGSNVVNSIDYAYSFGGNEFVKGQVETDYAPSSENNLVIPVDVSVPGRGDLTLRIDAVNGMEYNAGKTISYIAIDNDGYHRNFVVEEGTGTGCQWCPRGIVGMETMAKTYPETFIGVAVHCDWVGSDPMTVDSYQPLLEYYLSGLPGCIVNRDPIFIVDPSKEYLQMVYDFWANQQGAAEIGLNVNKPEEDAKAIEVETTTTFAYDDADAKYALAFVIIEDGLKGIQSNAYAGGSYGAMDGWGSKPSRVSWTYSDTARDIFDVWGIAGSVPSSVEKGTGYEYKYSLDMKNVKNVENTSVIAMLIDNETGVIINAKKVAYAEYFDESGITAIAADADTSVEYYNIQGVRMDADNLPAGLYIIRQGDKVQKSVIR